MACWLKRFERVLPEAVSIDYDGFKQVRYDMVLKAFA